jgi:hypothetical protein
VLCPKFARFEVHASSAVVVVGAVEVVGHLSIASVEALSGHWIKELRGYFAF